ncbi:uncharacterized protein LOC111862015 [Cryptotermes secundus]|uniref:uncharacterized protein LOC111862015 n=1 Tax=Cryptotermes secundus TaxID=105785 RepID=UPI000CD7D524|nr:uncharacterized protein LOC111862015 [Cryptotermes secundus]XP_033606420.1 uncharacterized protein LOC111862015 [Cryptotermes secundus]
MTLTIKCVPLVPNYNFCCCSCSLKTGILVMAAIGLLSEAADGIRALVKLSYCEEENPANASLFPTDSREVLVTRFAGYVVHGFVHGLLIYGVWNEKPVLMLPYILIQFIVIIIVIIFLFVVIIVLFREAMIGYGILTLLIGGLVTAFVAYLWAGVYTYYRQLEERKMELAPQNTTQILVYEKPPEEETIINPDEIRNAYTQIERNIQQGHPQAV